MTIVEQMGIHRSKMTGDPMRKMTQQGEFRQQETDNVACRSRWFVGLLGLNVLARSAQRKAEWQ